MTTIDNDPEELEPDSRNDEESSQESHCSELGNFALDEAAVDGSASDDESEDDHPTAEDLMFLDERPSSQLSITSSVDPIEELEENLGMQT